MTTILLSNWQFKEHGKSEWISVKDSEKTKTEIHVDLMENGLIPDPFIDQNEKLVQWVGEKDWDYKTQFEIKDLSQNHILKFNGLDTFASMKLNGKEILSNDNMFVIQEIDITKDAEHVNELVITFESALLKAREIGKDQYGGYCPLGFNGEGFRMYIRKAQYHYGWDWGPLLMTCGPYRDIELISYDKVHVKDIYVYPVFDKEFEKADLKLSFNATLKGKVSVTIKDPKGNTLVTKTIPVSQGGNLTIFQIDDVSPWFPNNYGDQPLYNFTMQIGDDTVSDFKFGMRQVKLMQEPLKSEPGKSFHFQINGVDTYVSGVDWIPGHSFQTEMTPIDYRILLQLTKLANFNMIRIWGGGYFEQKWFYQLCDELGIMVWHDFMFACGQYPGDDKFIKSVSLEIESQLKELRNYCSICLWCGNNEDYQVLEQMNLVQCIDEREMKSTSFPAQYLYEKVMPELVDTFTDSQVPYHRGSPYGGKNTMDQTVGDIHQWNVWHGTQESYQDWGKLQGRFVSEFGMLSYANVDTLTKYITDPTEWYPQSETVCFHNKASGSERRVGLYISENFKYPLDGSSLSQWCYLTQLLQSDCLMFLARFWRRNWFQERLQSGYIVWQLNDCWPVNSWAIVDYDKIPKLAYYTLKRENSIVNVACKKLKFASDGETVWKPDLNDETHQYLDIVYGVDLWCSNLSLRDFTGSVSVTLMEVSTGEILETYIFDIDAALSNQTTLIKNKIRFQSKTLLIHLLLHNKAGDVIYRVIDWPQPLKFLKFSAKRDIKVEVVKSGELTVESNYPVKGVELYSANKELIFEDNCIDLIPGDKVTVPVKNLTKLDKISIRYYDM